MGEYSRFYVGKGVLTVASALLAGDPSSQRITALARSYYSNDHSDDMNMLRPRRGNVICRLCSTVHIPLRG